MWQYTYDEFKGFLYNGKLIIAVDLEAISVPIAQTPKFMEKVCTELNNGKGVQEVWADLHYAQLYTIVNI